MRMEGAGGYSVNNDYKNVGKIIATEALKGARRGAAAGAAIGTVAGPEGVVAGAIFGANVGGMYGAIKATAGYYAKRWF